MVMRMPHNHEAERPADPLREKPVVLLSIKPQHAEAILDGEKRYEYRRTAPAMEPPYRVVLYATGDVGAAVGGVETQRVVEGPVAEVIDETVQQTPHDPTEVREYFAGKDTGTAIRVDTWIRYDEPVALDDRRSADAEFRPPQNFQYLQPDDHAQILQQLPYERGVPHER
jgi:predicted transcriptional regulator